MTLDAESRTMSPLVEARMTTKDQLDVRMELCLVCNSSVAHLELNSEGLGVYSEEHVVFCHDCGEAYHTFCLDPPVMDKSFLKPSPSEWRCAHCKFCVLCQQPHNESQLVVCDHCDRCFHSYCAKLSEDEINGDSWLCAGCRKCAHCHASFSTVAATTPALRRYALCNDCDKTYESRLEPLADLLRAMIRAESTGEPFDPSASMPPTKRAAPASSSNQGKKKKSDSSPSPTPTVPPKAEPAAVPTPPEILHSHMPPSLPLDPLRQHMPSTSANIPSIWAQQSQPTRFATQPQLSHIGISTSAPNHHPTNHPNPIASRNPHLPVNNGFHVPAHHHPAEPLHQHSLNMPPSFQEPPTSAHFPPHQTPRTAHQFQLEQESLSRIQGHDNRPIPHPATSLPRPLYRPQDPMSAQHTFSAHLPPSTEYGPPQGQFNPQFLPPNYGPPHAHAGAPHSLPQRPHAQPSQPQHAPVNGTTIELYSPNQHPFAIPPDAVAVVIGENGGLSFPQPQVHIWRQIFELSPSSYQQLCDFFRGLETLYSRFPAFLIPGGQFPVLGECPSAEYLMQVLLSGATPHTRPPYLLAPDQPLPSGTLLLPPREFLFPSQPAAPPQHAPIQRALDMPIPGIQFAPQQYAPPPNSHADFAPHFSMPPRAPDFATPRFVAPPTAPPTALPIAPRLAPQQAHVPAPDLIQAAGPIKEIAPAIQATPPPTAPPKRDTKPIKTELNANEGEDIEKREKKKRWPNKPALQKQLGAKLNTLLMGPPLLFILETDQWHPEIATVDLIPTYAPFRYVGCAIPSKPVPSSRPSFTAASFQHYSLKDPYYIDRRSCSLCRTIGDHAILGRLLPLQLVDEWVHSSCAVWAAEVFPSEDGELTLLYQATRKANKTHCYTCKATGASVACAIPGCGKRFHLPCLLKSPSRMVSEPLIRYAICPDHAARIGKVRWTSERRDANSAVPVDLQADDGPPGKFSMSCFDTFCKLHLSESDLRTKIAKHEGEVSLESWVNYIFRCGALTVTRLGCISTRGSFHTGEYIFPPGYRVLRRYWSWKNDPSGALPETILPPLGNVRPANFRPDAFRPFASQPMRSSYEIQICEDEPKLKFTLTCLDDPTEVLVSHDLSYLWNEVVYRVNVLRSATSSPDTDFDASSDSSSTHVSRRSRPPARPNSSQIANHLPSTFFLGLDLTHIASHLERLPGAKALSNYKRHHDMVIRLPSVQAIAVARYFDPDTMPDILNAPANESGAARCQPYVPLPPMSRFRQLDAFPDHPAAALVRFKELARTRARYNQPLYQLPQEAHIRGSINSHNMGSYSKLTRFKLMKASEKVRLKVLRSKIQGKGLFVMEDACEGEFLIEYVGEVISHRVADEREKRYQARGIGCYMFSLNKEFVIDATMQGNHSRFINHSCEPNCETQIEVIDGTPRIVITAKHALRQGEELTYDYHFEPELEKLKCYCGAPSCRGYMN